MMKIPTITPEKQAEIDTMRYEEEIKNARFWNFCHSCGRLYEFSKSTTKNDPYRRHTHCNRDDCIVGKRNNESKAVSDMNIDCLLEIIQNKIPNLQMVKEGSDTWNCAYRDGKRSIGFYCGRWGLEAAVQAILQIGIFGTEVKYVNGNNGEKLMIEPKTRTDWEIIKYCMTGVNDSIYFESETVYDAKWFDKKKSNQN